MELLLLYMYLLVSYALERYLLVAARVRRELQGSADAAIYFRLELLASIVFNNNHVDHFPSLEEKDCLVYLVCACAKKLTAISSYKL